MANIETLKKVLADYEGRTCKQVELVWSDGTRAGIGNKDAIDAVMRALMDELRYQLKVAEKEEKDKQQDVSYGELAALEVEFNNQCRDKHIEWTDEEVRQEALNQFIIDYQEGDEDPQVLLNGYGYFEYPPVLTRQMEMFKDAKKISSDYAIFGSRKALLEKHFNEAPIYLDDSYYAHSDKWPLVERHEDDYKGSMWTKLSGWRDCHYYTLYEWQGHRFFVMTGGRYD